MKKPREKIVDPQNTHEKKTETHETPTRKIFGPTNTHEKSFRTHKIPTRKIFGPTKDVSTVVPDPRNPQ